MLFIVMDMRDLPLSTQFEAKRGFVMLNIKLFNVKENPRSEARTELRTRDASSVQKHFYRNHSKCGGCKDASLVHLILIAQFGSLLFQGKVEATR